MTVWVSKLSARWLAVAALLMVVAACEGGGGSTAASPTASQSSASTSSSSQEAAPTPSPSRSSTPTARPSQVSGKPGHLFYQRDDYVVRSAAVRGGDEQQVLPLKQGNTLWLAAGATNLYWIRSGHLNYLTLGTSTLEGNDPHLITKLGLGANGLAIWDGYVYWANGRGYGRVKTDGTELDQHFMTLPPDHGGTAEGFAIADGNVYFSDCGGRRIGQATLAEGLAPEVEWLVDTGKFVCSWAVTVGGGHLYWWNHELGTVSRATTDGQDLNRQWMKASCAKGDTSADLGYLNSFIFLKYACSREGPTYIARMAEDRTKFRPRFRRINFVSAFAVAAV